MLAASRREDIYLAIIGDGPESEPVMRAACEAGVAHRVKMLGHVTERQKYAALGMSDIFVSTSQHEGFGLVFLEAMAYGLPIVCYDRGGQVDFLSTPATGALVKLNDIEHFTQAVLDLHASPELRASRFGGTTWRRWRTSSSSAARVATRRSSKRRYWRARARSSCCARSKGAK